MTNLRDGRIDELCRLSIEDELEDSLLRRRQSSCISSSLTAKTEDLVSFLSIA